MAGAKDVLLKRIDALQEIIERVPGEVDGFSCAEAGDLVAILAAAQSGILSLQGILAASAGEIARRSAGSNEQSLARRLGARSARGLVASRAGVSFGAASQYVDVGEMIRPNLSLMQETLPADREHIAGAVLAGLLPMSVAELIDETVHKVEHRLVLDQAAELEEKLVGEFLTGAYSIAQYTRYCAKIVELLDPDGAKPRADDLKAKAFLHETWLPNGMLRIVAELDPERAAFYKASMGAKTNPRRPAPADEPTQDATDETDESDETDKTDDTDETDATDADSNVTDIGTKRGEHQPSRMASKLEAFIRIMRDGLKSEDGPQAGVDTTILVRIDLDSLLSGIGSATIDGIAHPISASAARRLAVEADLIPQVFDGKSQLMDQGESKRRFTKAQRYAILANFVGCAFPKCDMPSSMVEFHHIGRWATRHSHGKGTDIENGLPLCGFHNRLMEQGWEIRFDEQHVPWFVPPATVDLWQRPLRGGNLAHPDAA